MSAQTAAALRAAAEVLDKTPKARRAAYCAIDGKTLDEVVATLREMAADADAAEIKAAYDEGRWCGECQYGVVNDPPCCTQGPVQP